MVSVQAVQTPLTALKPSGHLKTQVGGVVWESKKKLVLQAVQVVEPAAKVQVAQLFEQATHAGVPAPSETNPVGQVATHSLFVDPGGV